VETDISNVDVDVDVDVDILTLSDIARFEFPLLGGLEIAKTRFAQI
jgi:hypothetical protein